jgi:hypothetical protein
MQTKIHFVGPEKPVTLQENYDTVTAALVAPGPFHHFTLDVGGYTSRVTISKAAIAYVEETEDPVPLAAAF